VSNFHTSSYLYPKEDGSPDETFGSEIEYSKRKIDDGIWSVKAVIRNIISYTIYLCTCRFFWKWSNRIRNYSAESQKSPTYAIVTFTSRQAAVAARQCLTDGRGRNMWIDDPFHPVPPLAYSPAFNCSFGCCIPVTFTISHTQAFVRKTIAYLSLAVIYCFSTYFFLFLQKKVREILTEEIEYTDHVERFIGLMPGYFQVLYLCGVPYVLKFIALSGSGAKSLARAEFVALHYYWWFIFVIAFTGSTVSQAIINIYKVGAVQEEFKMFIKAIGRALPVQNSYVWMSLLLTRALIILPAVYLLQIITWTYECLGMRCCKLIMTGGMNGAKLPYHMHIDSLTNFLCLVVLSFVSPLVAPVTMCYYLFAAPIHRWNLIFLYKPEYDGGGLRWPFAFDAFISSLVLAQCCLALSIAIKGALGAALFAILPLPITILFRYRTRKKYLRAYLDAGLIQMSRLDGWDNHSLRSKRARENFREFLVDAHKAAYMPMFIAGTTANPLTMEAAGVIATANDKDEHFFPIDPEATML